MTIFDKRYIPKPEVKIYIDNIIFLPNVKIAKTIVTQVSLTTISANAIVRCIVLNGVNTAEHTSGLPLK